MKYLIEGSNRPSIILMEIGDPRNGKATREKFSQMGVSIKIFKETGH